MCMNDPEYALKSIPFQVRIPTSTGAFIFEHNKPRVHTSLLTHDKRQRDEFTTDLESVVQWITGGASGMRSHETDIYGVVQLNMEDISSELVDIASLTESDTETDNKKVQAEMKAIRDRQVKRTKDALVVARELADTRVKKALRITHNNLVKQWEIMAQDGKGKYTPSIAEAVGAHILHQEIEKAGAKKREMVDRLLKVVENTVIV